jgi:hypothetical protein
MPVLTVLVTNDDPRDAVVTVVGTDSGDGTVLAGDLVEDLVGLTVVGVDGTDQAVLRDVLEVATVLVVSEKSAEDGRGYEETKVPQRLS